MPQYKLKYFPIKGRAEPIRFIFAQAGVEYEDIRIPFDQWKELKSKTPWGSLPYLEVDGKIIGQSLAIARFLAREFDLAGQTPQEQALADSVVDALVDLAPTMTAIHYEKDEGKKKELVKKFTEDELPKGFSNLENFLGSNDYFLGKQVTWADLYFYTFADLIFESYPEFRTKFTKLAALFDRVAALPNIKKWLEKRPQTSW